jgi:hypothetical protein
MTITFGDVAENGPGNFLFHDWVTGMGVDGAWKGLRDPCRVAPDGEILLACHRHSKPLSARPQAWSTCSGLAVAHCPRAKA